MKKMFGNMMIKTALVIVMVSVFMSIGCKEVSVSDDSELQHEWQWQYSYGGILPMHHDPTSDGYNERIEFNKNGTFTVYRNNAVISSGSYTVTQEKSWLDDTERLIIHYDNGMLTQAVMEMDDHHLVLRDECTDYLTHYYQR